MLSRRSLIVVGFALISLVVLLVTSKRLGDWGFDSPNYHGRPPPEGKGPPGPPGGPPGHKGGPKDHPDHPSKNGHGNGNENGNGADKTDGNNGTTGGSSWDSGVLVGTDDLPPRPGRDPLCDAFPDTSGILLVMKTGASESYGKVPTQLMTVLKCLPDFLIYSDMDQHIAGYHVRDSLETVLPEAMAGNSDFDLYRRQRSCPVDQDNCNKLGDPATEGWNLDKYKNIHIAEKAYNLRPDYDWYVFVDADTYVLWPNLVQWLHQMKASRKRYLGSVTMINNFAFGHGGSGYVVSKSAMKDMIGQNPGVANKYDMRAKSECCGDYLFALAMKDHAGLSVEQVWPTINGEKPNTLPYGPTHWCHPIVTMHHMNSEEISSFWEFERRRYSAQNLPTTPPVLTIKDIYTEFLAPKLRHKREDWDNLSDDWYYLDKNSTEHEWEDWRVGRTRDESEMNELEKKAHLSFDDCRKACESVDECFQFRWSDDCCGFSKAFMLGKPVKKDSTEKKRSMSGWAVEKIHKWVDAQGTCDKIKWPGL